MINRVALFLALGSIVLLRPAFADVAAEKCHPWTFEDEVRTDLIVGEIEVQAGNVFDPDVRAEHHKINRLINYFHIQTRPSVVEQQLLFRTDEPYVPRVLDETERLLRGNRYIKDAYVKPVTVCGNRVKILVTTTDHWSLTPEVSFGRAGGVNTYALGIEEHNFLGFGKTLTLIKKRRVDRDELILGYEDSNLFGSRKTLLLRAEDNSDGQRYLVDLARPFYALDTRYAWRVNAEHQTEIVPLFTDGVLTNALGEDREEARVFYGWSSGLTGHLVRRWGIGWLYEKNQFSRTAEFPAAIPPPDRELNYPFVNYELFEEKFVETSNLRSMGSAEDVSLGHHLILQLGLPKLAPSSNDQTTVIATSYQGGIQPTQNQLGLITVATEHTIGGGPTHGFRAEGLAEWYMFHSHLMSSYVSIQLEAATNLNPDEQIVLGGDTGLRGYPLRFQSGDRLQLFTAEERFHFDWYPYHLVKMGAEIFVDSGTAWDSETGDRNLLTNIGFGLRLVPTRSSGGKIAHIDFAFPLSETDKVDSFQFLIKTKTSF